MGILSHNDGLILEGIVRNVYGCDRGGVMNVANADILESRPMDAVLVVFAPLYKEKSKFIEIEEFVDIYSCLFNYPEYYEYNQVTIDVFIRIFKYLVNKYVNNQLYSKESSEIENIINEQDFNTITEIKDYLEKEEV